MKFEREDHGNARVYFRGHSRRLYCFQEDQTDEFTLYACSKDGEPEYRLKSITDLIISIPTFKAETGTGEKLQYWIARQRGEV